MRHLWLGENKILKFVLIREEEKMANENKNQRKGHTHAKVNSDVKDYGNEPFFVKKANDSKQFLEKHGFPKALQKRSSRV
jgi:hypothetical protein